MFYFLIVDPQLFIYYEIYDTEIHNLIYTKYSNYSNKLYSNKCIATSRPNFS
jgi:hypothetical protein